MNPQSSKSMTYKSKTLVLKDNSLPQRRGTIVAALIAVVLTSGGCRSAGTSSSANEERVVVTVSSSAADDYEGGAVPSLTAPPSGLPVGSSRDSVTSTSTSLRANTDPSPADPPPTLAYLLVSRFYDQTAFKQQEDLILSCMEGKGWQYYPATSFPSLPRGSLTQLDFANERGFVSEFGYAISLPLADAKPNANPLMDRYVSTLTEEQQNEFIRALYGTATSTGCFGSAHDIVFGTSALDAVQVAMAALNEIELIVHADSEVVSAEQLWSVCMGESGYAFSSRSLARQSIQDRYRPDLTNEELSHLQSDEHALAMTDLACYEAEMLSVVTSVRRRVETEYLSSHPEIALAAAEGREQIQRAS
jgi:hypothetical protein